MRAAPDRPTDTRLLLGVDIGTSSAKAVVADVRGRVVAEATRPHGVGNPAPGHYEHDAEVDWWQGFVALVGEVGRSVDLERIGALSVSGIGPAIVPVDAAGAPLRRAILYGIDTRGLPIAERLNERAAVSELAPRLDAQAVVPKMIWIREKEPEVWARTTALLGCGGFLTRRLTGRAVLDLYESGSYAPLLDADGRGWAGTPAAEELVPRALLPELVASAEPVGAVTAAAAAATGLPVGCPVIAPTVDAAAEATGAGVGSPGDLMLMYGSTGFFILVSDEPRSSDTFWTARFLDPGTYSVAGGTNTLGTLFDWFRAEFGAEERAAEARGGRDAFSALAMLGADSPPGANGLLALPYFAGERTPVNDPDARGALLGLTLSTTRADVYRALLEGIAFAIRDNLELLAAESQRPTRILAVGGGAKNPLLLQTVSDVTGLPQGVPAFTIGAALGDALRAGVGLGLFPSVAGAAGQVPTTHVVTPDPAARPLYEARFALYRSLYASTREIAHALAVSSAVRAP